MSDLMEPEAAAVEGHNHPPPTAKVELTVYEWHVLLEELQHNMRVVNRDTTNAKFLWGKISGKLNGSWQ